MVICVLFAAFLLGQYIYPSEREPVTEESITYTGTFYRMLGESKLRQLFVSNASILSNMCFFVVMICPIPILFYIDSVQQGRYRKVYHVAECITCVNLVLCTALQVLNIADFISTMFCPTW